MKRIMAIVGLVMVLIVGAIGVQAEENNRYVHNPAAVANVFHAEEGIQVWRYNTELEQGFLDFYVSYDEMATAQALAISTGENVLIIESGDISMWALATGEYQVNSPIVGGGLDENIFS